MVEQVGSSLRIYHPIEFVVASGDRWHFGQAVGTTLVKLLVIDLLAPGRMATIPAVKRAELMGPTQGRLEIGALRAILAMDKEDAREQTLDELHKRSLSNSACPIISSTSLRDAAMTKNIRLTNALIYNNSWPQWNPSQMAQFKKSAH